MKLEPKKYLYDTEKFPGMGFTKNRTYFGFIAQDVEQIIPDIVTNKKFIPDPTKPLQANSSVPNVEGYYIIDYTSLIPILTKAIQQQQEQILKLQEQIQELENKF